MEINNVCNKISSTVSQFTTIKIFRLMKKYSIESIYFDETNFNRKIGT